VSERTAGGTGRLVGLSEQGQRAAEIFGPLEGEIEGRWQERFGAEKIGRLRDGLAGRAGQLEVKTPDYLPVGEPRLGRGRSGDVAGLGLTGLVSKALLGLALDFEERSKLSLGIYTASRVGRLGVSANMLRVLDGAGTRTAQLPGRTGLAKMAVDNWLGALEGHGYLEVGPDPAGSRFRVGRLTGKGLREKERYEDWARDAAFPRERPAEACDEVTRDASAEAPSGAGRSAGETQAQLREVLTAIAGDAAPGSPLRQGMTPYPEGWRAQLPEPETLPQYPAVTLRGGYPDGS
jgi:DNA-binding MarR family transcriptional regulator